MFGFSLVYYKCFSKPCIFSFCDDSVLTFSVGLSLYMFLEAGQRSISDWTLSAAEIFPNRKNQKIK